MPKFRKKPVVIEAQQVPDRPDGPLGKWLEDFLNLANWCDGLGYTMSNPPYILIETLEGPMRANRGDWIIKGVKGEFYPCKPDIFKASYEPVPDTSFMEMMDACDEDD